MIKTSRLAVLTAQMLVVSPWLFLGACSGTDPALSDAGGSADAAGAVDGGARTDAESAPTDGGAVTPLDGGSVDATTPLDAGSGPPALSMGQAETLEGRLRGEVVGDMVIFRGVPYAAAPVGDRRFRAPDPPAPWPGVRDATRFGPACPQLGDPVYGGPPEDQDEDCLTLNVWTPADAEEAGLPVTVWIHGGGYKTGAGSLSHYEGQALARHGLVVVSLNYRLGPLGYLAHPQLSDEAEYGSSGNYGLLDQTQALRWVQDNVASFGGDPDTVTIFGESAGGGSVCQLVASPLAAGLFERAIIQSATCTRSMRHLTEHGREPSAESVGLQMEEALGCDGADDPVECMRDASIEDLLTALPASEGLLSDGVRLWPIVDGHALLDSPGIVVEEGRHNPVDVMTGFNANEAGAYRRSHFWVRTVATYRRAVRRFFGGAAPLLLELYPVHDDALALATFERLQTEVIFACSTHDALGDFARRGRNAWLYRFDRESPALRELGLGAVHGAEVPYVFQTFSPEHEYEEADYRLAAQMTAYWARFAITGDPNGEGVPTWPAYAREHPAYLTLDEPMGTDTGAPETCDALAPLY